MTARQILDVGTEQDGIIYVPDRVFEQIRTGPRSPNYRVWVQRHAGTHPLEILPDSQCSWPNHLRLPEGL
mgnify:CR=1 FL=1